MTHRRQRSEICSAENNLLGSYATLDDASKANNWPTRAALASKVFVEAIPGTVEEANPTDKLHTDVEIAQYLRRHDRRTDRGAGNLAVA